MVCFRFVHLSDLHIATQPYVVFSYESSALEDADLLYAPEGKASPRPLRPTSHSPLALAFAARFVNKYAKHLHAVVISGDLATTGRRDDLQEVLRFLRGLPSASSFAQSKGLSAATGGIQVLVIPGNHDRYHGIACHAGGAEFENVLAEYWPRLGKRVSTVLLEGPEEASGRRERLALVGADFSLERNDDASAEHWSYLGQGRVYETRRDELVLRTVKLHAQIPNCPVFWVVHFPPEYETGTKLALLQEELLVEAARSQGVHHILCGHAHTSLVRPLASGAITWLGGSTSKYKTDNWLHVFEVSIENGVVKRVRRRNWRRTDTERFTEVEPQDQEQPGS